MNHPPSDQGSGPSSGNLDAVSESLARRLRSVCAGMDSAEFDALILKIAQFKIRWGEAVSYGNHPSIGTRDPDSQR